MARSTMGLLKIQMCTVSHTEFTAQIPLTNDQFVTSKWMS
jgi:hypothetical protein